MEFRPPGPPTLAAPSQRRGGLVFIGATQDHKFRASDPNGKVLGDSARDRAYATPYVQRQRKQYVAVAVGGGRWKSPAGDFFVAFALPPLIRVALYGGRKCGLRGGPAGTAPGSGSGAAPACSVPPSDSYRAEPQMRGVPSNRGGKSRRRDAAGIAVHALPCRREG